MDVTDETYEGPSAHISALGNGVVKHLKWAGIGILLGGLYAAVDSTRAGKFIEGARKIGSKLKIEPVNPNMVTKAWHEVKYAAGSVLHFAFGDDEMSQMLRDTALKANSVKVADWFNDLAMTQKQGFGNWFISHVPGSIPFIGKGIKKFLHAATETVAIEGGQTVTTIKNPRFTNALTFGGAVGLGGYISGWLVALVTGVQHGNRGKRQFQRAQEQINDLKNSNADLNKINEDLHQKYVKASTRLDSIQAAQDAALAEQAPASEPAALHQASTPTSDVQLSANEHQGKLAQKELAVA